MGIPPLVLFDVDGTLLLTGGATSRCIRQACRDVLGPGFVWTDFAPGLLDPEIFALLAGHNGCAEPMALHGRYRARYLEVLEAELDRRRADVSLLPGVEDLLGDLVRRQRRGEVALGLVTGNYGDAVLLKLRAAGVDPSIFGVRAFAEDGQQRRDLVAAAIRRYGERAGVQPAADRVVVVGDTPRDVECAHAEGCVAFCVATGWYDREALLRAGADHCVHDFTSSASLLALLTALSSPETGS